MMIVRAVLDGIISLREKSGDEIILFLADRINVGQDEALFKNYKKLIIDILTDKEEEQK